MRYLPALCQIDVPPPDSAFLVDIQRSFRPRRELRSSCGKIQSCWRSKENTKYHCGSVYGCLWCFLKLKSKILTSPVMTWKNIKELSLHFHGTHSFLPFSVGFSVVCLAALRLSPTCEERHPSALEPRSPQHWRSKCCKDGHGKHSTLLKKTGWWDTYPSEKYEFVNWDDYSQYNGKMKNVPNHQSAQFIPRL